MKTIKVGNTVRVQTRNGSRGTATVTEILNGSLYVLDPGEDMIYNPRDRWIYQDGGEGNRLLMGLPGSEIKRL